MPPESTTAPAAVVTTAAAMTTAGKAAEPIAIGITSAIPKQDADGNVMVKPISAYLDASTGEHKNVGHDAYAVSPTRAAELFANGLVEYASEADFTTAIETKAKAEAEAIRARRQVR